MSDVLDAVTGDERTRLAAALSLRGKPCNSCDRGDHANLLRLPSLPELKVCRCCGDNVKR